MEMAFRTHRKMLILMVSGMHLIVVVRKDCKVLLDLPAPLAQ